MWVRGGGALFRATKCQGLTSVKAKLCFFFSGAMDIYRGLSLRHTASKPQGNTGFFCSRECNLVCALFSNGGLIGNL